MHYGTVIEDLIAMVEKTERTPFVRNRAMNLPKFAAGAKTAGVPRESTIEQELNADPFGVLHSLPEIEQAELGVA